MEDEIIPESYVATNKVLNVLEQRDTFLRQAFEAFEFRDRFMTDT